jgi:hypothetical protein
VLATILENGGASRHDDVPTSLVSKDPIQAVLVDDSEEFLIQQFDLIVKV